jgi:hypothetical protein
MPILSTFSTGPRRPVARTGAYDDFTPRVAVTLRPKMACSVPVRAVRPALEPRAGPGPPSDPEGRCPTP